MFDPAPVSGHALTGWKKTEKAVCKRFSRVATVKRAFRAARLRATNRRRKSVPDPSPSCQSVIRELRVKAWLAKSYFNRSSGFRAQNSFVVLV
jgi:hypothetical protein